MRNAECGMHNEDVKLKETSGFPKELPSPNTQNINLFLFLRGWMLGAKKKSARRVLRT